MCLFKAGKQKLDKALLAAEQTKKPAIEEIKDLLKCAKFMQHNKTGTVAYCWNWMKWYSEFPEVAFVEAFMGHLNTAPDGAEYFFIRVGESDDDIEQRGVFWENPLGISLTREITFAT